MPNVLQKEDPGGPRCQGWTPRLCSLSRFDCFQPVLAGWHWAPWSVAMSTAWEAVGPGGPLNLLLMSGGSEILHSSICFGVGQCVAEKSRSPAYSWVVGGRDSEESTVPSEQEHKASFLSTPSLAVAHCNHCAFEYSEKLSNLMTVHLCPEDCWTICFFHVLGRFRRYTCLDMWEIISLSKT